MSEKAARAAEVHDPGLRADKGGKAGPKVGTEFRGLCRRPGGKVAARIVQSKGQFQTWLGTFDTAEDATGAFDAAAIKIRGAATRTNFKQAASIDDGGVSPLLQVTAEASGGQDPGSKFRGVCATPTGKFGARIRQYKGKARAWLGSFNTAEDAAMAYDAAAIELHGARAITNFKQSTAVDDGVSPLLQVPVEPSGCRETGTDFRGVWRTRGGKFGARIRQYKGKPQAWLGTFDTAEDAAMAYDAAAVELHGARAITNFKQHRQPSGVYIAPQICDWKGKAALSLGGFGSAGTRHDDPPVDLLPAEWQQVNDLLKDMDSADDREALLEAAAILQHISQADMDMVGGANQHKG